MFDMCNGQLKLYSSITETNVDWLWYPFIPFGKLTLVQGDPGCGKSTLMMNIIAAASKGGCFPDGRKSKKPMHIIYQCSEDGVSDTIKPRLAAAGADCTNVAFLDEEIGTVTLNDETIRRAIADFNAKLLVIDPVQAYLGETDMASAASMRKVLRQLSAWASMYHCAVVLVGHLNKKQNSKDLYRSLGSIDLVAAARSVLQLDRLTEDDSIAVIHHIKSSLAAKGKDLFFTVDCNSCLTWIDPGSPDVQNERPTKQTQTAQWLKLILSDGPVRATDILEHLKKEGISERTIQSVKKALDIRSVKKDNSWYWQLPTTIRES